MASPPLPPRTNAAFFLAGPTGAGKSAVALALARRIRRAAIVNADAFQLYAGMEILTAAPGAEEKSQAEHHLYGVLDPGDSCDAAHFAAMAVPLLASLAEGGIRPLVVGGSGLYLKALTHGLAPVPPGDPSLRSALETLPLPALARWHEALDPEGSGAADRENRRHLTRSLEICLLAGKPASALRQTFSRAPCPLQGVLLAREPDDLRNRIAERAAALFRRGVVEEVRRLDPAALGATARHAIGLAEVRALLAGEMSEAEAVERISAATRRYAKRQRTWFRREEAFQSVCLAAADTPDSAAEKILRQFPGLLHPLPPADSTPCPTSENSPA